MANTKVGISYIKDLGICTKNINDCGSEEDILLFRTYYWRFRELRNQLYTINFDIDRCGKVDSLLKRKLLISEEFDRIKKSIMDIYYKYENS